MSSVVTGNTPTEGRTVDGRERETESVKRKEDKVQDWTKGEACCQEFFPLKKKMYFKIKITKTS